MKNSIKIIIIIIGTLIGAGFASGQEIYVFFFAHGIKGILGIIVASSLLGWIIQVVLEEIRNKKIKNYKELIEYITRRKKDKKEESKFWTNIINFIVNAFIIITFFIMIAAFGGYLKENTVISQEMGSIALAIICFIIFMGNLKGVMKVSSIILPVLVIGMIGIGFLNITQLNAEKIVQTVVEKSSTNWLLDSILYASYNSILLIPGLIVVKDEINSKKQTKIIGIIIAITISVLAFLIFTLLIPIEVKIAKLEMPVAYTVAKIFPHMQIMYQMIILSAILTTAISLGISFLQNNTKSKKSYRITSIIICILSIPIAKIGFAKLVSTLYPFFGYLGLIQILAIFRAKYCKKKKKLI